jgi:hypothetical protein
LEYTEDFFPQWFSDWVADFYPRLCSRYLLML